MFFFKYLSKLAANLVYCFTLLHLPVFSSAGNPSPRCVVCREPGDWEKQLSKKEKSV